MLCCQFYSCWCRILHYGEGKCSPFYGRWCRRYGAHFNAIGAAFSDTARVNAARLSAVGCGRYAANFSAVDAAFCTAAKVNAARFSSVGSRRHSAHFTAVGAGFRTTARVNAARFAAVGVGVMLPLFLLLVPLFTQPRGKILPVFRRLV